MIQKRFSLLLIWILVSFAGQAQGESTSPYSFDKNGIQKEVLENYLDRSITVTNLLVPNQGEEQLNDDIRMIQNIGAKFLGRSILLWENEQILKNPTFWTKAEQIIRIWYFKPVCSKLFLLKSARLKSRNGYLIVTD